MFRNISCCLFCFWNGRPFPPHKKKYMPCLILIMTISSNYEIKSQIRFRPVELDLDQLNHIFYFLCQMYKKMYKKS